MSGLAHPQPVDRRAVARVHHQVKAAQAFDRQYFAGANQFRSAHEGFVA